MVYLTNLFAACLIFFTSSSAYAFVISSQNWPQTLQVGGVSWTLGGKNEDQNPILVEYITNNETLNKWTQLLTFQMTQTKVPDNVTPKLFAETEASQLRSKKGQEVTYSISAVTPTEALLEFSIHTPKEEQQNEVQRIIKTPDKKLIIMHYVVRKEKMDEAEKANWIAALKQLEVR